MVVAQQMQHGVHGQKRHLALQRVDVYKRQEQLQKELGREPHITEIAKRVELPAATVTLALESVVDLSLIHI